MLKKSRKRATRKEAPAQPAARPNPQTQAKPPAQAPTQAKAPAQEYAALGTDAPIAWPSVGGRRVPVTGKLSPHAAAALKRMGITKE
ncbi:MAG TPA: hypothetical protein VGR11_06725 [Solirubrobacteraceae bacterium]|nr:hypothetical protein [Solirubrobacteraceae bacterium]